MKTTDIIDLRRRNVGGATGRVYLKVKDHESSYWYAVGDAAQAVKRIEQELHDTPPDGWSAFRELWAAGRHDDGLICIADTPEDAIALVRLHSQSSPYWLLDLNRQPTRRALGDYLGEDFGKYGTSDL